jgi:tetratricopeptide (TPR) repeat protein
MKKTDRETFGNREGSASEEPVEEVKAIEYLRTARAHLRNGQRKSAYSVLLQAMVRYPQEPVILSYLGTLQALVDKKYRSGVESCKRAIALFKPKDSHAAAVLYPVLYLNLGRTCLAADRKKDAIEAFQKGLSYDNSHNELRKEVQLLGIRKKPPLPFLCRSNPINKYMGKLLNKTT